MNIRPKLRSPPPSSATSPSYSSKTTTSKMPRKSLLRPTLVLTSLLALVAVYSLVFHAPPKYTTATSIDVAGNRGVRFLDRANDAANNVRIYMYDLPRRFTYGVIESYAAARGGGPVGDDSLLKYPGNQHSAEWYLFADLNRPSKERIDSAVTRVMDPKEADLFYVPFFSSLSLVANPVRSAAGNIGPDKTSYSDEQTQVRIHV